MRLFVPLTREEFDRLRELAREQRRRPQDQAAVLLAQSLNADPTIEPPATLAAHIDQSHQPEVRIFAAAALGAN